MPKATMTKLMHSAIHSTDPTQKIMGLIRTIPCLSKRYKGWNPEEFDPEAFYSLTIGMSHGEKLCALFILNVWNPSYARQRGWEFDVVEFAGTADAESRSAFLLWMADPVWP